VTRLVLAALALLLLAALVPAAPLAKGAHEARIEGPGLDGAIVLGRDGRDGVLLMDLAQSLGFFAGVFGQEPDPMQDRKPGVVLGPRYEITWSLNAPGGKLDELRQDVYPYAKPWPVSYIEPGQRYFTTERTRGGWFVGYPQVKQQLIAVGLPTTPPAAGDGSEAPWTALIGALVLAIAVIVAASMAGIVWLRRRPGGAPAEA
jgi:hypothetical protein